MISGDPADFAIEAMTEPELVRPSQVWGRMCLRIGNTTLGDYDDPHCGLHGAYSGFKELADGILNLWDSDFNSLDDSQIFDLLNQSLYGDDDRSLAELQRDWCRFGRFIFLTNWDEPFDHHKAFIACRNSEDVLILYELPNCSRGSVSVTPAAFVNATHEFLAWYDSEAKRLS